MTDFITSTITYIQNISVFSAIFAYTCTLFIYIYLGFWKSSFHRFLLLFTAPITVIWQVQFFEDTYIRALIVIDHLIVLFPMYKREIGEYPIKIRETGIRIFNEYIPNSFTIQLISTVCKILMLVILGMIPYSCFWVLTLIMIEIFRLWTIFKGFLAYRMTKIQDNEIQYSVTFTVLSPFSAAYLIPHSLYGWVMLGLSLISFINRDFRTAIGKTDLRKRTNSIENNYDSTIHLLFVVFSFCTFYFSEDIFKAIVIITFASILRLIISETLRILSKLNKTKRLVVITEPSHNKEHYSRLIKYLVPSGSLWTTSLKDTESRSSSFLKFFFPKFPTYYSQGKHYATSELLITPLLSHIYLSDFAPNEQRLPALKRGLNSVFGIVQIHSVRFTGSNNTEKQELELLTFFCDEESQDIALSRDDLTERKLKDGTNTNISIMSNLARERLEVSGSYEALRLNIQFLDSLSEREDMYRQSLKELPFDLFTIHRQLYEIPSLSGRFSEMFHIYEMIMRYLSCSAMIQLGQVYPEKGLVSMGATASELRSYMNISFENIVFQEQLNQFLKYEELDKISVKTFISTLKKYTPDGTKFTTKPSVATIFDWTTTLRNRTKGHGSTSKVNPKLVYALNTLLIEILIKFHEFNLEFSYSSEIKGYRCKIKLLHGGLPKYEVVEREEFESSSFQKDNVLKMKIVGLKDFQECTQWFKVIDGRVHVYDGIDSSKNTIYWYNFLTSTRIGKKLGEN